jgi:hypothetical protein
VFVGALIVPTEHTDTLEQAKGVSGLAAPGSDNVDHVTPPSTDL